MGFANVDMVYLTLAFLTPGLIIVYVRSQFTTGRIPKPSEQVLTYLTLSGINYGLLSPLIYFIANMHWFSSRPLASGMIWFFIIVVWPSIIGLASIYIRKYSLFSKLIIKLGLHPVNAFPTSWDRKFYHQNQTCFVIVTLKDGSTIAGYYGKRSFASSEPGERDLFLEQMYEISDNEEWTEGMLGKGILISHSEIRCIEFIPTTGSNENDRQEVTVEAGISDYKEELQPELISAGKLPAY